MGKSVNSLSTKVICLVLQDIAAKGHDNKLEIIVKDDDDFTMVSTKKRKAQSEYKDALVHNITFDVTGVESSGKTASGGGSGGGRSKERAINFDLLCKQCGLFCKENGHASDPCKLIVNGKISIKDMLALKFAIFKPKGDARWKTHQVLITKLQNYGFKAMGISDEAQQKKLLSELEKAVSVLYDRRDKDKSATVAAVQIVNNISSDPRVAELQKQNKKLQEKLKKQAETKKADMDHDSDDGNGSDDEDVFE